MSKKWREKDGRPIHDGDCHFWGQDICTCGLIHHLLLDPLEDDWFAEECARQMIQMKRVPKPLLYVKPTEKEIAKRQKLFDEICRFKTPAEIAMERFKEYKETLRRMK